MTDQPATNADKALELHLDLDIEETKAEVLVPEPQVSDELQQRALAVADKLIAVDPDDQDARVSAVDSVERMGRDLQRRAATRSRMLQAPLRDLSRDSEEGGPVAKSLSDLRIEVEKLDPTGVDLSPGGVNRLLGLLPGVGSPLQRYFMRFESSQGVIDAIIRSLESGRDQLKRDNVTLNEDQKNMRELTLTLTDQVALAQALDTAIGARLEALPADDPRRAFIEEEIVFLLRQRIMDLQQQLAVNQQGVLATAIIVRNNRELIRGVERALDVTISALQVAVAVAMAVAHQKVVLDKVEALNRTTSDLIAGTATRLKTQGSQIHQQAASTMLDMESLKSAFGDINIALDEIARYRREALPQMAQSIVEMDQLTTKAERTIEKYERSTSASGLLELEVGQAEREEEQA
ncbi:MAG: toxic anion resistance protein [Candidatus Limnocylindrales bacterium]